MANIKDDFIIKYAFTDSLALAASATGFTGGNYFPVKSDGSFPDATGQNFFYLFIPSLNQEHNNPNMGITGVSDSDFIHWELYSIKPFMYGTSALSYKIYKISFEKNTGNARTGYITLGYLKIVDPTDLTKATINNFTLNVRQNAGSDNETGVTPATPSSLNYRWRDDVEKPQPILQPGAFTAIYSLPHVLTRTYAKEASSSWAANTRKFFSIYKGGLDELSVSSTVTWARFESAGIARFQGYNYTVQCFELIMDENSDDDSRNGILSIKHGDAEVLQLKAIQLGQAGTDAPTFDINPSNNCADDYETKYWEAPEGETYLEVMAVDNNEGADVDPTSLLYKSNDANIYATLEQKDNTLFLGNYLNNNTINKVHETVGELLSSNADCMKFVEGYRRVEVKLNGNEGYPYVPDLYQDSQQKRLFKKGEEYALGLVFVNKTGDWSSVYHIDNIPNTGNVWAPKIEPVLSNEGNGVGHYDKSVGICWLSGEMTDSLSQMDIIGVIPVYASKTSHKVLCQGYLSPTLQSSKRNTGEGIEAQYSWFLRSKLTTATDQQLDAGNSDNLNFANVEIQNLTSSILSNNIWKFNKKICSLNTPETEVDEKLTESMLSGCECRQIGSFYNFNYYNNVTMQTEGKYVNSFFDTSNVIKTNSRFISGLLWWGFIDRGFSTEYYLPESNQGYNYAHFWTYPWMRNKLGGEGPSFKILNKRWYTHIYVPCESPVSPASLNVGSNNPINNIAIYRDFDTSSLIKLTTAGIYQGNTDYIETTDPGNAYKAWTNTTWDSAEHWRSPEHAEQRPDGVTNYNSAAYPFCHKADSNLAVKAGYDEKGDITDPINIKYKTAPHIVVSFENDITSGTYSPDPSHSELLNIVELYSPVVETETDVQSLGSSQWLKCGDMKRIVKGQETYVFFEEGDWFFGRFDSLRTYPYTNEDVNSVTEVVSGMLCSTVNLDARCDRNRGITVPTISPVNFNIFNSVYNQVNNFFTFVYEDISDIVHNRGYHNSIQWSMTKNYSSDVDEWCNIQEANTLDLDGDKGEIRALCKLGNNLIAFQDTGIAQIQYNEKTQIATSEGVPIEIANSGKVDGKYYLYDHVGCQEMKTIAKSPSGIYFIDEINKTIYLLGINGQVSDICTVGGMKSWAWANIDNNWWSYYDVNTQEVLFTNEVEALAYSDAVKIFNSFLGYGNIRWNFRIGDKMCQICPPNFNQVISSTSPTLHSSLRIQDETYQHVKAINTFWKKNSQDSTRIFGNYSPIEIQLQCNPEPTLDKIFSTVEFRADCFDSNDHYYPDTSFDLFRAWNEYQDTLENVLIWGQDNRNYAVYSRNTVYRLKKKFRIWRIDIPRAYYGNTVNIPGNTTVVPDITNTTEVETEVPTVKSSGSRDRIRNPWCNIYLAMDTSKAEKIVVNDIAIQYFR